jgi:hypothetical protein
MKQEHRPVASDCYVSDCTEFFLYPPGFYAEASNEFTYGDRDRSTGCLPHDRGYRQEDEQAQGYENAQLGRPPVWR